MHQSIRFSDRNAILSTIDPASISAGTVLSGWVPVARFHRIAALIATGVLGASATFDAKFRQATDGSGTGAKDVPAKAITQLVKASHDNKQAIIEMQSDDIDTNGGYTHVALSVTVATASSLACAFVLGVNARFLPASDFDDADVVQIVG